jgi:hypothetical protein
MITKLKLKPDFDRVADRFEDWWLRRPIDGPLVSLWVKPSRPYTEPERQYATLRERWMDVEFVVDRHVAWLEQCDWLGDSLPLYWPNVGPEITATLFGCELEFGERTSWSKPIIHDPEQWTAILEQPANFENEYWQAIERMTRYAIERNQGRFLVGMTDLHGNYDILAALREPMMLCTDVLDCPETLKKVGAHVSDGFVQAFQRQWTMLHDAGMGSTSWLPMYHPGPAYIPSCDFWCMVSPQIAEDLILPDILTEMRPLERSIFHLDGPGALRHLDLLLKIPTLDAIQWVFGAGNGPATRWIDVYRKILASGKSVQVTASGPDDALAVVRAIGSEGVWLLMEKPFETRRSAEEFLAALRRL